MSEPNPNPATSPQDEPTTTAAPSDGLRAPVENETAAAPGHAAEAAPATSPTAAEGIPPADSTHAAATTESPEATASAGPFPFAPPAAAPLPPSFASGATSSQAPGTGFPPPAAAPTTPKQRSSAGPLIAGLALGALVGGASGAGIAAWAVAANFDAQQPTTASPQTITVNDPDDVNAVNAVAAKVLPSVVTIGVSSNSGAGTGSGVILSEDGYVLTNNHVVTLDGASDDGTIEVTTSDGRIFQAEVVGNDPIVDLAVIKLVDASGLTPIEFGDVDALDVGDRAVAVGAPLGLSNTVTDGIVSALNRSIEVASSAVPGDGSDDDGGQGPFNFDLPGQQQPPQAAGTIAIPVIQTDAAINPGNSGGALVDDEGRLVGINVAIASAGGASTTAGSIGVGFAIPADLAQRVADELIESGEASHGLLGASVRTATSADGSVVGGYLAEIVPGGAAEAAGLEAGDIVTELDGTPIADRSDLTAQVRYHAAGEEVELTYVRDGRTQTVEVTLGEYVAP